MLSLSALVRWRRTEQGRWLLVSGGLMSVSLGIKLFTAFLLPVFAAWLVAVSWLGGRRRAWQPALFWLLAVVVPLGQCSSFWSVRRGSIS